MSGRGRGRGRVRRVWVQFYPGRVEVELDTGARVGVGVGREEALALSLDGAAEAVLARLSAAAAAGAGAGGGGEAEICWTSKSRARLQEVLGRMRAEYGGEAAAGAAGAAAAAGAGVVGGRGSWREFWVHERTIRAHVLPVTSCAFDKAGTRFVTGSYDRTARVFGCGGGNCGSWTEQELFVLEGHKNVVHAVAWNLPVCDKVVTGSFDRTARVFSAETGACLQVLTGHTAEVVAVAVQTVSYGLPLFRADAITGCSYSCSSVEVVATGSMDGTARLWVLDDQVVGAESGGRQRGVRLGGHKGEVVSVAFSGNGRQLLSSSFDMTARLWLVERALEQTEWEELNMGEACSKDACGAVLAGHVGEVSAGIFSADGEYCVTGSTDRTGRVWDVQSGLCVEVLKGHSDEVVDVAMSADGRLVATASADGTAKLFEKGRLVRSLEGHAGEVNRVMFAPNERTVVTASDDSTMKIWDVRNGACLQTLEGHSDEVFACMFNYWGDRIVSASKDNTCKLWKLETHSHL